MKKLSQLEREWKKEARRINKIIRDAEREGYVFNETVRPKEPKRITKASVASLKKRNKSYLYERSYYLDNETGTKINGAVHLKMERAQRRGNSASKTGKISFPSGTAISGILPKSPYIDEWNKQNRRIMRFIRNAEKRGFHFDKSAIPTKPAIITKGSVNKLRNITPNDLYKTAKYIDPLTGEVLTGVEGRKLERKRAAQKRKKKPPISDVVLRQIEEEIAKWQPSETWSEWLKRVKRNDKNILQRMLEGAIRDDGRDVVAKRLEDNAAYVIPLVLDILYGSGRTGDGRINREYANSNIAKFSAILVGRPITGEEAKELNELQESLEYEDEIVD